MRKRLTAGLLPYIWRDRKLLVYMQMRARDSYYYPGHFGFFGGRAEPGETPDECIRREIQEELEYQLGGLVPFKAYEVDDFVYHTYLLETTEAFVSQVVVHEGQYGVFISEDDFDSIENMIPENREILADLRSYLKTEGK